MRKVNLFYFVIILFISSCAINGDGLPQDINGTVCSGQTPIVMVHGLLASGDTYEKQVQRFMANGICKEKLFTFDWNSLGAQNNTIRLNVYIKKILQETNATQVHLVGHSAGGGLGYSYLQSPERAQRVAKYVHLASAPQSSPAGPMGSTPTLNIYSDADAIGSGLDIPGARNLNLIDKDHYQVATSLETFIEMYDFLYGNMPTVVDLFDGSAEIEIAGKVVSFGENLVPIGAHLEIYELDPSTGFRISSSPQFDIRPDAEGFWGPIDVKRETNYEFLVYTNGFGDRPVHYYREAFNYPDPTVYIRNYPPTPSIGGLFLGSIPKNNNQSVVAFFGASQAAVNGRDILKLNDVEISTPALAPQSKSLIAMFCYDNGDGNSSYNASNDFASFPFLNAADVFMPTTQPETITMEFNNRILNMRNWKSGSEGVNVAVFN